MPVPYTNRVEDLINTYRANPHLFNEEQLDELQQLATQSGIKFSPIRQELSLRNIVEQAASGFMEGLTTIPVGEKPRTTYESIAHSLGHLVGFAPGIMAGPLSLGAKGAAKLGAKIAGQKLTERELKEATANHILGKASALAGKNISVPMLFGGWVKKGAEKGLRKAKLDTYDFMKRGAATRAISMEAVHLGAGMAISNIWKGPDAWMQGAVGGAVAGGFFGGLGNFRAIGNLLKSKNVQHHQRAEQLIKGSVGATAMGAPAYMRGEPIESVMYETLLGGYFGYKGRPAREAEGGKFVQDLMYYPKKDVIFTPDRHPNYKDYSKGAQEYIMKTATEQSQTYLKNQYPDIPEKDFQEHFRLMAKRHLGKEPTQEQVNDIMRQEATQHYFNNFEYVENPFETTNRPLEPSYEQKEDINHSSEKAPETTNLELQKQRYNDNSVMVVEFLPKKGENNADLYTVPEKVGEYRDSRVGESKIDSPIENFEGTSYKELSHVYQPTGGRYWKKFRILDTKIEGDKLVPLLEPQGFWRIDSSLNQNNKHLAMGVKDKGTLRVRDYHLDTNTYTSEQLRQAARISEKEFNDSLDITAEWYGKERTDPDLINLHDKQWKSHVLSSAENFGLYLKGSNDLSGLGKYLDIGPKNVTDFNKRTQLQFDKGAPLPADTFSTPLNFAILKDYIDKTPGSEEVYTIKNKNGKIEEKYNDSNTDGTIYFTPEVFDVMMKRMGLPVKNVGMNKPVIMMRLPEGGVLMAKSAGAVAEGPMLNMMREKGLQVAIFDSAAKQKGALESREFTYDKENKTYDITDFIPERDVMQLDPTSIRLNLGTFENPKEMYGTHFVKQFFGNLNEVQTPGIMKEAYNEYFLKSYEGNPKANEAVDNYLKTKDEKYLKKLDVDQLSIKKIHDIMADNYNSKIGKRIRDHIYRLEKEGKLRDIEDYTKEEYIDYLARNERMMDISQASESATKLFKATRKYSDKVYKKYMLKRLVSPKYKYSAKSWLSPKLPHHEVTEGTFKAGKDFNPTVKVGDKDMKLTDLWRLYEKNPKKYSSALDFAVIRVPSDSVSGTRVLKFNGFTDSKGTAIHTSSRDNVYLGGADKDSDSVFLYQGLNRNLLKSIKKNSKEWQDKDGHWIEGKSDKYEELLRGKRDPRYETRASQFSPGMRMFVAMNAYKGNAGLGFVMKAKNTMLSWIDIANANGGIYKGTGFTLKLKNNGGELRRLAREMINTSADAANYPNITDYSKWREALFETTFEATIGGKKSTFSDLARKTSLGQIHNIQNTLDFKGKSYPKGLEPKPHTLDDFQINLGDNASKMPPEASNIYSRIARDAYKLGLDRDIKHKSLRMSDYHRLIRQANVRINPKDNAEAKFVRDHFTHLIRVGVGLDAKESINIYKPGTTSKMIEQKIAAAEKSKDWEKVLDMIGNDTFTIASNNAMAKKGLEIYREFKENGLNDPTNVMDKVLISIAKKATELKNKYEIYDPTDSAPKDTKFADYDAEIQGFKIDLAKNAADNKIPYKSLAEYFDLWMISPYSYGSPKTRKGGTSRLPMQSQEISSDAWKQVLTEYEAIYQNITTKIKGEPVEPVLFTLPKDYNRPASKQEQGKLVTEKVLENIMDLSPLKNEPTSKREFSRKALSKEDFKDVEIFESNMKKLPHINDVDKFISGFTLEYMNKLKTVNDLTMLDIKSINRYFKDKDRRMGGNDVPSWVHFSDPKYVDEYMWNKEMTMYPKGYKLTTEKGKEVPIYKGVGTLGTIRNWFRHTNRQMDVYTDAVPDVNNNVYKYRTQLTPNESWAITKAMINRAQAKHEGFKPFDIEKKYLDRKYTIDKKEYTFEEVVTKYHKAMAKDLKQFGTDWLYAVDKKGNKIDFNEIDKKTKWTSPLEGNEYLKWKKDGSLDIMHFINKAVSPGDSTGARVPRIPLENIYRFQFEYNLEKQIAGQGLTGAAATKRRIEHRKKGKFEGIDKFEEGEYFPHLDFGWNKGAKREIDIWKIQQGEIVYQKAIEAKLSEAEARQIQKAKLAELDMKVESSNAETGGMDKHAIDEMLSKINYKQLTPAEIAQQLESIGFNTRPENLLRRLTGMPGYRTTPEVFDLYKEKVIRANYRNLGSVMANYRIDSLIKNKAMGEFTKKQYNKYNPKAQWVKTSKGWEIYGVDKNGKVSKNIKPEPLYENWSDVWGDLLKFYVRDSFGHQTTFPERVIESMKHGDPLKLKNTMYMTMSDHKVIKGIEKIDKQFKKYGIKAPFFHKIPQITQEITAKEGTPEYNKQVEVRESQAKARKQYLSDTIHNFGRLEARYELLTLLANTGTLTANMFGGTTMNISSAGIRNFVRVNRFKWLKENVLFDKAGKPTLTYKNNEGKEIIVKTKEQLKQFIQDMGVIDNFINDELSVNLDLKSAIGKNKKASMSFIRDLKKLLKENPDAKDETVLELAKRYGVQDAMLQFGGSFMRVSERKLRRDSFLSHALQAKDALGEAGRNMPLNDPYLIDKGLKGVEATQFLYHSAFRPAFMRTSLGKVATRFKLFAFQSVRTRKELLRRAQYYGYKEGTPDYERMKNLFVIDMLTMALGTVFAYSLFDTALPPPYDWLQETSELVFGDKRQRERAFFGTYPRAIAPLQIVTPPSARVLMTPIKSLINNDWERFLDYHIHTMYPFGRIVRQFDKTFYDPQSGRFEMINEQKYGTTFGRFMQQFFRLPTDKAVSLYNRAQLQEERKRIISQTLGE